MLCLPAGMIQSEGATTAAIVGGVVGAAIGTVIIVAFVVIMLWRVWRVCAGK